MKAIVQDTYGSPDVLQLSEFDTPVIADDEVLVRVHAAGVDQGVWHLMAGLPYLTRVAGFGLRAPKNPVRGYDVAGRVEAVGQNVTRFQPGERGVRQLPRLLRRVRMRSRGPARAQAGEPHLRAGRGRPHLGLRCLQAVRDRGKVRPGQSLLIIGAGEAWGRSPCSWPRRSARR
jgi:alcohol dehydrogenase-like protein